MLSFTMSLDGLTSSSRTAAEILNALLPHLRPQALRVAITCAITWALLRLIRVSRRRFRTTKLRGPPSESFLYGVGKRIRSTDDSGSLYEAWAREYGPVFAVPSTLGSKRIVLCDPKAVAHFYAKESWTYVLTPFTKNTFANIYGKGLLWADGENHKRQRRSLMPAFSVVAVRQMTSIFFDNVYKAKGAWDGIIESSGGDGAIIEVQSWINHIVLDTLGLACFSHEFGALETKHDTVTETLDQMSASPASTALNKAILLLGFIFPILAFVPTSRTRVIQKLNAAMGEISEGLLARTRREMEMGAIGGKEEKSIIGLLIKGDSSDSEYRLTKEEILAQMKVLLLAGYETSSISLTWSLLELSCNPDIQKKLRKELIEHGPDPTYDQLSKSLPYLDAFVHEVLRLHLPIVEVTRVAIEDDVIPLSQPVYTPSGELIDSVKIARGTLVSVSMESMNRSTALWGEDAKFFRPSRWLEDAHGRDGIPAKAKEVQGYRHILTFSDGARTCPGKHFAVTEIKAVLAVLVKNFVFELRDGSNTKIAFGRGVFPRPKLSGEVGCKLPLRVRPYVA